MSLVMPTLSKYPLRPASVLVSRKDARTQPTYCPFSRPDREGKGWVGGWVGDWVIKRMGGWVLGAVRVVREGMK